MPGPYPSHQDFRSLERRITWLSSEVRKATARALQNTTTKVTQVTSYVTSSLAAHLAAYDPHPQYLFKTLAALLYAPINTALTPERIPAGSTFTIPADHQMVVFGTLTVEGDLVVEGTLVIR